jgi:hypothetical protein
MKWYMFLVSAFTFKHILFFLLACLSLKLNITMSNESNCHAQVCVSRTWMREKWVELLNCFVDNICEVFGNHFNFWKFFWYFCIFAHYFLRSLWHGRNMIAYLIMFDNSANNLRMWRVIILLINETLLLTFLDFRKFCYEQQVFDGTTTGC